ncbi:hypothetical protein B0H13DRAFT_1660398, partial [Mycena leptocephala]
FVPEGTAVYVAPYTHRRPRYFSPDPDRFWPERRLQNEHHHHGNSGTANRP